MIQNTIAAGAHGASESRDLSESHAEKLHEAIHTLVQPLTALAFLLELAQMQADPQGLREAVTGASAECKRAFLALEEVRDALRTLESEQGWM